jgi:hypothetical protein
MEGVSHEYASLMKTGMREKRRERKSEKERKIEPSRN